MQQYKVGNVVMTQQAFIVLATGFLLSVILILGSLFLDGIAFKIGGIISSLIVFGLSCYQAYVINCTIVGQCNSLAWFLTGLFVFGIVINVLSIYHLTKLSPDVVDTFSVSKEITKDFANMKAKAPSKLKAKSKGKGKSNGTFKSRK